MVHFLRRFLMVLISLLFIIISLNFLFPLNTDRLNKPQSTLIYDKDNQLIALKLSSDGFLRIPIEVSEISSTIKETLIAYEDQYFYHHFGMNPLSILRAMWFNMTHQNTIGASTLTMQVARMMHNQPRTLSQKMIELFQALQLEWYYSKEEILIFYLNNAPYGGNVEGFASASHKYFQLPPASLSLAQIAYLTSIPKNPNANRPQANGVDMNAIKNRLLKRIEKTETLQPNLLKQALEEEIHVAIKSLPNEVPHITAQVQQEGKVYTTLNLALQKKIETLLATQVKYLKPFSIHNGAAIVIENKMMNIVAYVPSHDFYDAQYGGQNNGLTALISPGSTLKPFIYAKALEEGLISPLKKIFDVPLFIEGYKPSNYAKEYLGEVTATEALQLSLNIPAIELDRLLQDKSLYFLLKSAKIDSLKHPKSYYGSSLSLGGLGLSLQNNAELFAMLANQGVYAKASFLKDRPRPSPKYLLQKESSYLVSRILSDAPRREFSSTWGRMQSMQKIAFKTGTSAHAKDLLTLGYTPEYTVAVWYGNFSGKASRPAQGVRPTGLQVASPTMFEIFSFLGVQTWFQEPSGIQTQTICQDAIDFGKCQEKVRDKVIEGVTPKQPCQMLRAEVFAYLQAQNKIETLASFKAHPCYRQWTNYKPLITSPTHGETYVYNQYLPQEMKKTKLQCFSFAKEKTLYWLIDEQPILKGTSAEALYHYLAPGQHKISCLDERSKMKTINITVEEL